MSPPTAEEAEPASRVIEPASRCDEPADTAILPGTPCSTEAEDTRTSPDPFIALPPVFSDK